ncbi:MAG: hypothetical protein KDK27_09060, partial [Leptospiraceae bacterium]|nr:hypothetical protein [Leptospiraceae bacterium]
MVVDVNLSPDKKVEVEKALKYIKNMESIVRTSPNPEQKARVQKEISKYRERIGALVPGYDTGRKPVEQMMEELGISGAGGGGGTATASTGSANGEYSVLGKYEIEKASRNSTDPDVNFLATVLSLIQREYWPVLSDVHCKLDFSHSSERDTLRQQLENVLRNLKVLCETIEEYANAEKQDFREQLLKMKNRQSRSFIYESNEILKKLQEFMGRVASSIEESGSVCTNPDD